MTSRSLFATKPRGHRSIVRRPNLVNDDGLELKMTPMIDVVFLLLVFFVWTSSFEVPEFNLPSSIAETPQGGSEANTSAEPPQEVFDELVIKVGSENGISRIYLNGKLVSDTETLQSKLTEILSLGVQPPVIVDPDPQIQMSDAVEVYDVARLAGADRVLFAAEPQ